MDGFQPHEFVVVGVDAEGEEESSVTAVDELVVAELGAKGGSQLVCCQVFLQHILPLLLGCLTSSD
jgi:hypothetical protein